MRMMNEEENNLSEWQNSVLSANVMIPVDSFNKIYTSITKNKNTKKKLGSGL